MTESINVRLAKVPDELTSRELRFLLQSALTDITALKTSLNQLITDYNANANIGTDTTAAIVTLNTQA